MQVTEVKPHGVRAGRAAHAIFTQKELVGDGFGLGVIPWMDVTAEGLEDAVLPESIEVKEATLRMLREATKIAPATLATTMENRVRAVETGNPVMAKNPEHVFPPFQPVAPPQERRQLG